MSRDEILPLHKRRRIYGARQKGMTEYSKQKNVGVQRRPRYLTHWQNYYHEARVAEKASPWDQGDDKVWWFGWNVLTKCRLQIKDVLRRQPSNEEWTWNSASTAKVNGEIFHKMKGLCRKLSTKQKMMMKSHYKIEDYDTTSRPSTEMPTTFRMTKTSFWT